MFEEDSFVDMNTESNEGWLAIAKKIMLNCTNRTQEHALNEVAIRALFRSKNPDLRPERNTIKNKIDEAFKRSHPHWNQELSIPPKYLAHPDVVAFRKRIESRGFILGQDFFITQNSFTFKTVPINNF